MIFSNSTFILQAKPDGRGPCRRRSSKEGATLGGPAKFIPLNEQNVHSIELFCACNSGRNLVKLECRQGMQGRRRKVSGQWKQTANATDSSASSPLQNRSSTGPPCPVQTKWKYAAAAVSSLPAGSIRSPLTAAWSGSSKSTETTARSSCAVTASLFTGAQEGNTHEPVVQGTRND